MRFRSLIDLRSARKYIPRRAEASGGPPAAACRRAEESLSDELAHVSHHNLTVLTTDDATTMEALLARPDVRALVWKRLDATRALVDTERLSVLVKRLKDLGYPPRFSSLAAS